MQLSTQIQDALKDLKLDPKTHLSVTYRNAKEHIDSLARNRSERRAAKFLVVEVLGGKYQKPAAILKNQVSHAYVVFPDNSKAKF